MSAIHITDGLLRAEGVRCRRKSVRGSITPPEFIQLRNNGRLRTRVKTTVKHACGFREGGSCFQDDNKEDRTHEPVTCFRRKIEVSGVCRDCQKGL